MAVAIFTGKTNVCVSAQLQDGDNTIEFIKLRTHKCLKSNQTPRVSYNFMSTVLNVSFPSNSQGCKVEIYRNGAKVINAAAPAGASLSYVLRNYGVGNYTVVVSSGKTVVYSNNVTVK